MPRCITDQIQQMADAAARERGMSCAHYVAKKGPRLLFAPMLPDSAVCSLQSPPYYIMVTYSDITFHDYEYRIEAITPDHMRTIFQHSGFRCKFRGQAIIRDMKSRVETDDFPSDSSRYPAYRVLYAMNRHQGMTPIDRYTLFAYLEASERLHVPCLVHDIESPNTHHRIFHIKLSPSDSV